MKKIQVIEFDTNTVVKEIDVSNKTDREIERIEDDIHLNLDHEKYYTILSE